MCWRCAFLLSVCVCVWFDARHIHYTLSVYVLRLLTSALCLLYACAYACMRACMFYVMIERNGSNWCTFIIFDILLLLLLLLPFYSCFFFFHSQHFHSEFVGCIYFVYLYASMLMRLFVYVYVCLLALVWKMVFFCFFFIIIFEWFWVYFVWNVDFIFHSYIIAQSRIQCFLLLLLFFVTLFICFVFVRANKANKQLYSLSCKKIKIPTQA